MSKGWNFEEEYQSKMKTLREEHYQRLQEIQAKNLAETELKNMNLEIQATRLNEQGKAINSLLKKADKSFGMPSVAIFCN